MFRDESTILPYHDLNPPPILHPLNLSHPNPRHVRWRIAYK